MKISVCLLILSATFGAQASSSQKTNSPLLVVRLHASESATDTRLNYQRALLQLALKKTESTDGPFTLQPVLARMARLPQSRALEILKTGEGIDVVGTMGTNDRSLGLFVVPIPLDRGLLGMRVLMIRRKDLPLFAKINSPSELKKITVGVGHDWPDGPILKANHFKIQTGNSYEALFPMLAEGRFFALSRGAQEPWAEMKQRPEFDFAVEPHFLLRYPAGLYFHVAPQKKELAERIEKGLRGALNSGEFLALFNEYFGADLANAQLEKREIIDLQNPLFEPLNSTFPKDFLLNSRLDAQATLAPSLPTQTPPQSQPRKAK